MNKTYKLDIYTDKNVFTLYSEDRNIFAILKGVADSKFITGIDNIGKVTSVKTDTIELYRVEREYNVPVKVQDTMDYLKSEVTK